MNHHLNAGQNPNRLSDQLHLPAPYSRNAVNAPGGRNAQYSTHGQQLGVASPQTTKKQQTMSSVGRNSNLEIEQAILKDQIHRAGTMSTNHGGGTTTNAAEAKMIGGDGILIDGNAVPSPTTMMAGGSAQRPPLKIVSKISQVINVYSQPQTK